MKLKDKPDEPVAINKVLNPLVKEWFFKRFKDFSLPQLYGVMEIHSRNNCLISAPTGATKTLTGFLSVLNELVDSSEKGILEDRTYCVYVSPLKALNYDIEVNLVGPLKEMEELAGKKLGIRVGVRTGDTTPYQRQAMAKKAPHILITTPESLAIILSTKSFRQHLSKVDWLIIDEIHALADNKRGSHLSLTLERLQHLCGHVCRIGLSATVAPLEEVAHFLVGYDGQESRPCTIVDVQFIKDMDLKVLSPVPDIMSASYDDLQAEMYRLLDNLIQDHKTTLIFTNTRAATERVVDHLRDKFPKNYTENIGAHHGSLSKEHRHNIEKSLREGKLKAVVCSTSLELGIDIGFIDLVILLGSPKSVARALQRVGRSGHQLHATTKGRVIVMDRDDLVECSVILKSAIEKKIDRLHIPRNSLDVLSQHIYGMAIDQRWSADEMFSVVKKSYCFYTLSRSSFNDMLDYLSGEYVSLEDRHVYAKIWHDKDTGEIGKRGKLARVIYMTNIGTIPDESNVKVKIGERIIGSVDEGFVERLKRGDIFVLGGATYEFLFSRGMTLQVKGTAGRPPTVPSWFSEMLPLSFDLALEIGRFRNLMREKLTRGKDKEEVIKFINDYLYVDANGANAIYEYFREQHVYAELPTEKSLLVEHYDDQRKKYIVFHSLYGRRVNDVLSRVIAYGLSRNQHVDVEIGINDNGFYLSPPKSVSLMTVMNLIKAKDLRKISELAIEKTEVLSRRFRHCATRSLMILRSYMGRTKQVGRQQMSSLLLYAAVKRISNDFPILREARREVLEDLMDVDNATRVVEWIESGKLKIKEISTTIPSPFAFNLIMQGYTDVLKMEDRHEFLKNMHQMVRAKISLRSK